MRGTQVQSCVELKEGIKKMIKHEAENLQVADVVYFCASTEIVSGRITAVLAKNMCTVKAFGDYVNEFLLPAEVLFLNRDELSAIVEKLKTAAMAEYLPQISDVNSLVQFLWDRRATDTAEDNAIRVRAKELLDLDL